eukprot:COSAG02_NODE_1073_length_14776_cov_6.711930_3_plen_45_part_00
MLVRDHSTFVELVISLCQQGEEQGRGQLYTRTGRGDSQLYREGR